jgi:glycine cleavage system regulatory protein
MSVELVKEVWAELKRYVNTVDREEAAESLVSLLVDHDVDIEDIRAAFKSDPDIKAALIHYLRDDVEDEDDYDEDDDDEDEDY